jgi:putative FmdB family regulatory protein
MIYQYKCDECGNDFDVIRSVKDYNIETFCKCGVKARKVFSISRPIVDKTQPEYYPSLGTVVKSKYHKSEIMKKKGLIEVGNEKPSTVHREMKKTLDHKIKTSWEKV